LERDVEADVAIVGAGYTGLWTAFYLKEHRPDLEVLLIESETAGFGASGRNGGWCSALVAGKRAAIAASHGRAAAVELQRAMFETVDEIGRVALQERIDAGFVKGGTLTFATNPAHVEPLVEHVHDERAWGFGEQDIRWLSAHEARARIDVPGALGAVFTPHCAAVHPAKLVRGLARAVERKGATIYERTAATDLAAGTVKTTGGNVKADVVVRATEAYTPRLPGLRRSVVPIYSLMVATEPLPPEVWDRVGWEGRETFSDGRHMIIYAQRTADDRIALGGRGAPYHFASRTAEAFDRNERVFSALHRVVQQLFPAAASAEITHRWGGPLAAPRDWRPSVGFDRSTGAAWAGGYVGDGVGATNLAGRTLADLILERDTALVRLPWVGHRSRPWEPEPLRWLGASIAQQAVLSADRAELRTGKPSQRATLVAKLVGRPV
jgi:glycine/D-amino acid oxidase-like deaminating enzyme